MIFVSTGSQLPFDRFVKIIDDLAAEINEEFVVQAIPGEFTPKHIKLLHLIPQADFKKYMQQARVVLAHAGMGNILMAMELGKPIIVMPRLLKNGEVHNDHQLATVKYLQQMGYIYVADNKQDMAELLNRQSLPCLHKSGPSASQQLVDFVGDFICNARK